MMYIILLSSSYSHAKWYSIAMNVIKSFLTSTLCFLSCSVFFQTSNKLMFINMSSILREEIQHSLGPAIDDVSPGHRATSADLLPRPQMYTIKRRSKHSRTCSESSIGSNSSTGSMLSRERSISSSGVRKLGIPLKTNANAVDLQMLHPANQRVSVKSYRSLLPPSYWEFQDMTYT